MNSNRFASLAAAFILIACPAVFLNAAADPAPIAAPVQWAEIKDYTYDMRASFLSGLKGLEARVDEQMAELAAKRATMDANNTSTKDWDFAMQEMNNARTHLKSAIGEMAQASRETWDQQKDKVGVAWIRTQDAYAKVKSSTTT
jgi:hypothetical protein